MKARTILTFPTPAGLNEALEKWAPENGFKLKDSTDGVKTYQKGIGFLVAPMMLKVAESGGQTTMEAWIRAGLFVRIMALFILPAEMGVESGGFRGVAPRSIARKAVNKLMSALGQAVIP